jgi:adenylate cyclase
MPNLIATGKAPQNHWEKVIPHRPVTLGRLASESEWVVDWDVQISRKHATLEWRENKLLVRKEATARNAIFYRDGHADEFTVGVGEQFFIGNTKFEIREDQQTLVESLSTSVTKAWFEPADLQQVKFSDAETRIEILAALPGVIRTAPSVEELQSRVLDVLLDGVARAESAAVVRVDVGADGGEPKIEVLCERSRSQGVEALNPSRSLITDATQRLRRSILQLSQPDSDVPCDAPENSFDWAICSPLPDEPSPGIALYLCGHFETKDLTLSGVDPKVKLKPDIKFTGLVADIFGSLLQVLHLQRREAQFSLLLSAQIREALVGRDMETVLSPRETDVTVLFCDLRGSSRVADDHESELMLVWEHVSSFLGIMTASISDQGGVIGDFQGDAAMGFFGWPKGDGGHAGRAARAALIIRKKFLMEALNKNRTLAGFQCGIGIATGRAIAGRLGVYEQAKVGVYGPRVNLASRLESMTKALRVPILLDDVTADQIRAEIGSIPWARLRRVARVRPYGMAADLMISELLPPVSEPGVLSEQNRRDYEAALEAFVDGNWGSSRDLLSRLHRDGPSEFLLAYMEANQGSPPPGWGGVIELDHK